MQQIEIELTVHLFSDKARCFSQSERALYGTFIIISIKCILQYKKLESKIRGLNILQEQNGFPQLETLCLACGSLAGVPRTDGFLYRFVTVWTVTVEIWGMDDFIG